MHNCFSTKKHLAPSLELQLSIAQLCCCLLIAVFLVRFFLFQVFFCISIPKGVFCSDYLKLVHFLIQVKKVNLSFKILKNLISRLYFVSQLILVPLNIHIFELHGATLFFANLIKEFADERLF